MTAGRQFGRSIKVQLGTEGSSGRELTGLRVRVTVERTDTPSPNAGTIEIYNPAPDTVALMQAEDAVIRVLAGYDIPRLLFHGDPIPDGV